MPRKDKCPYCQEPIGPDDEVAPHIKQTVHEECGFRMVVGSIAHIQGRCGCFVVGSEEGDPPGMTKRLAARAAFGYFKTLTVPQREAVLSRPTLQQGYNASRN